MKFRSLQLDFRGPRRVSLWLGWALLTVAFAFAADLGFSYFQVRDEVSAREERLASLSRVSSARSSVSARSVSKEEIAFARETIQRMALPWDQLFGALESVVHDKIALIAIEPDPKTGTVLISGESQDYSAALDYVEQLRRTGVLREVHLVKHERQQAPGRHLAFSVSASWGKTK